jgi:hypothetical protein
MIAASATLASAQLWEVGVIGGYGYSPNLTVNRGTTSASTGIKNGAAIGFWAGEDMYRYFSGEANYLYRTGDLKLSGEPLSFGAHTHLITGDFLVHFRPREARIRPYISFGGGIAILQGTGQEGLQRATDPVAFTATREVLPVGEAGIGVKIQLAKRLRLRVQVRDYITEAPRDVLSPVPGATLTGVRQDVIGMVGLGATW